jgi:steroid delta-isomerase-like uncharacterized protein
VSTEENKAIIRRYTEEVWSKGNLAVVDEIFATNYVAHNPLPGQTPGVNGLKQSVTMVRAAFPDWHATVEDMIAEEDKVVNRWSARGTHQGEFMGIAPTGKQITLTGISIQRIAGGKIVEDWLQADMMGMMQQLGVVPPPGQHGG